MLKQIAALGFFLCLANSTSAKPLEGDLTCQSETSGIEILITLDSSNRGQISLTNKGKKGRIDCSSRFKRRPEISANGSVQYSFALSDFKCGRM